jgi:hypothetical protein
VIGCSFKWLLGVSWLHTCFQSPMRCCSLWIEILSVWIDSQPIYKGFCTGRLHAKVHETYTQKLVATWMGILQTFLFMSVSWMPAYTITDFSCSFQKYNRNSGHRFWIRFSKFGTDYNVCIYTHRRELMKSGGEEWQVVTAVHDQVMVCYFLRTLIRSWLHSFLSCSFWVCWRWHSDCLKMLLSSFICNLIDIC